MAKTLEESACEALCPLKPSSID